MVQPNAPVEIYQLHILLLHINPPIWRRLHVRSNSSIATLAPGLSRSPAQRGEDTIRTLKHAKRLRRSHVHGCGAAEIHLDRGSAMCGPRVVDRVLGVADRSVRRRVGATVVAARGPEPSPLAVRWPAAMGRRCDARAVPRAK